MSRKLEQELEKRICRRAVKCLLDAGYDVGVNDGGETVLERSTNTRKIYAAMYSTDEDYLLAVDRASGKQIGWVRLIYGNCEDVISDYTTNLEAALKSANDYAERYH